MNEVADFDKPSILDRFRQLLEINTLLQTQWTRKLCLGNVLPPSVFLLELVKGDRLRHNYGKGNCHVINTDWSLWGKIADTFLKNVVKASLYENLNRKLHSVFGRRSKNWFFESSPKWRSRDHCVNNGRVIFTIWFSYITAFRKCILWEVLEFHKPWNITFSNGLLT